MTAHLTSLSLIMGSRGTWLAFLGLGLVLPLAGGCAGSSTRERQAERPAAYAALPEDLRALVNRGELAMGMDTNAVFIAWGQPGEIGTYQDLPDGPELRWRYFRDHIEDQPAYVYAPSAGPNPGINVYTIHYTTSWKRLWREVAFRQGRVYWWQTWEPPAGGQRQVTGPSPWPVLSPR